MTTPPPPTLTTTVPSPVGPLTLTAVGGRLTGLHMADQAHAPSEGADWVEEPEAFKALANQLEAYFAGERTEFVVDLWLRGTDFQRRVWQGLLAIPYGETWSYGQLAAKIGRPAASRAVGLANGRNPVAIVVPCHRVIGADGSLTGYGGGLERKAFLLDLEASVLAGHPPRRRVSSP